MPEKTQMPEAYMYRWPAPTFKSFPTGQTAAYYMTQDICNSSSAKADHRSPSQLSAKQTEYLSQTTDGPSGIHNTNGGAGSGGHARPGLMAPSNSHDCARYKMNPTKLRMAFLHRASADVFDAVTKPQEIGQGQQEKTTGTSKVGRQYNSQMHGISLKGTERLPDDLKKTTCKPCNALVVPEATYSERTEDKSRDQREQWVHETISHAGWQQQQQTCSAAKTTTADTG